MQHLKFKQLNKSDRTVQLYILDLIYFEKLNKYILKAKNSCGFWEFLAFKSVFIFFFKSNLMIVWICTL